MQLATEAAGRAEEGRGRDALLDLIAPEPPPSAVPLAASVAASWSRLGVVAAAVGDPSYPSRLSSGWPATGGPPLLAWRGPAAGLPAGPAVAIVGARRATSYGTGVAGWLAEAAAESGCAVVSGGAVGIDAAAHAAAVSAGGPTAVVLGCGHAVSYPRVHAVGGGLFDRVLDAGGWLYSELPPEARPHPSNVLARNRLVAGMVDAVVVVEGGERSGTLRTAAAALDRGVPVLAVPGDVRAPGSAAPHRLLAEGAAPCSGPRDLLELVGGVGSTEDGREGTSLTSSGEAVGGTTSVSVLPDDVRGVLEDRWPRPVRVDELAERVGSSVGGLLGTLTRARMAGEIAEAVDGVVLRRAPG